MSIEENSHSHELLKYIIEHTRSAIAVHDRELNYLYVSQRYLDEYNVENQDVIGKHHYEVFPDLPQKWRDVHQRVLAGEVLSAEEDSYPKEDGSIVWTRWECRPWYEADGSVGGIIVYTEVITDRISARERLRESEHKFRTLFDQAADTIFLLKPSPDGLPIIADVNPSGAKLHGYTPSELIGRPLTIIDPFVSPEEVDSRTERLEFGEIVQFQVQHLQKNGEHLWLDVSIKLIETDSERFYLSTERDITDRKKAEKEQKRLSDRLLLATASAQLGIWDWNVRENTMVWDDRMFELYGVTREETPNNLDAWMNGLHPEDKEAAIAECQAALNGEKVFDTEFRVQHPDGTVRYLKANGLVITGADGKPDRMLGINAEITEQKKAEAEKVRLVNQLQQSQKVESIGQLAGGVAHDFNNMLGVILGHAEMALMKADPSSPFISDLQEISNAAQRSSTLTRQLLTFARKQIITPKVLDLNETVGGTLKMLQRLIGENIQLLWNPAANLWPVKVDPSQVDQIMANLCVNARDAISGIGKITIKTENRTMDESATNALPYDVVPGDYVLLSVSDDGCGMDKKTQAHIFEPFYTTKEVGSGTGLGLATVYGAVKQNGGFLTVYSEPGLGTVFNIYLPRTNKFVEAKLETVEKPLLRGTETILLVEDDEMLLRMVTTMLEESGYTVLAAAMTAVAESLAKEHSSPIHLLISDMIMPVMNGKELSARLQLLRPEMKVLFLSGYTADIISDQGIIKEDIHFLQKPFSLEVLTSKVREVLDDH